MGYADIIGGYKAVLWDGKTPIKCPTGVFPAEDIKTRWNIGPGVELYYIVPAGRTVAVCYGTDLGSPYPTEDIAECAAYQIKDMVEDAMRQQVGDAFEPCPIELVKAHMLVHDQRG